MTAPTFPGVATNWLDQYTQIQQDGTPVIQRHALNLLGSGANVTDNPTNDSTDVTIVSGVGWVTALDLDLTNQGTQTIAANGAVNIGGYTWTKQNSANEATALQLTQNVGLTFKPASATIYSAVSRTFPCLSLAISQVLPAIAYGQPIRIWADVSSTNAAANYDSATIAVEYSEGLTPSYVFKKGFNGSGNGFQSLIFLNGAPTYASDENANAGNAGDGALVLTLPSGYPHLMSFTSSGAYSEGWPADNALNAHASVLIGGGVIQPAGNPQAINLTLGAEREGSATPLAVTYARLRVDYKL